MAVNSCTAAMHLALEAIGVSPGDEVVVPDMTFAATAEVVVYLGARPVFVDCHPDSLLINEENLEAAITPRTKAIMPVHYAGQACEMDAILELARQKKIKVIEDAAHAFPASYKDRIVGAIGHATAFSFYATKPLAVGEGGMLTTDDEAVAERARIMSLHGMTRGGKHRYEKEGTWRYELQEVGFKYNMPELQAALGLVQLNRRQELQSRRIAIANRYVESFSGIDAIQTPGVLKGRSHAWHLFVVQLNTDLLSIDRDRFIEELKARSIGSSVHFIPLHRQPVYLKKFGLRSEDFPNAEAAYHRIVSLPIWPDMSDADVDDVITAIREIVVSYA